jgi:hypothetical protein
MTSETRTTIQPSDFKAIELECNKCHHRIVRPMGIWRSTLLACPDCGENWSVHQQTMSYLMNLASQLIRLDPPEGCAEVAPFTVRFEISADKKL